MFLILPDGVIRPALEIRIWAQEKTLAQSDVHAHDPRKGVIADPPGGFGELFQLLVKFNLLKRVAVSLRGGEGRGGRRVQN